MLRKPTSNLLARFLTYVAVVSILLLCFLTLSNLVTVPPVPSSRKPLIGGVDRQVHSTLHASQLHNKEGISPEVSNTNHDTRPTTKPCEDQQPSSTEKMKKTSVVSSASENERRTKMTDYPVYSSSGKILAPPGNLRAAIFVQVRGISVWKDLKECIANVVATLRPPSHPSDAFFGSVLRSLDIYVVLAESPELQQEEAKSGLSWLDDVVKKTLLQELQMKEDTIFLERVPNGGADLGMLLSSFITAVRHKKNYDVVLKIHSKSDPVWRTRMMESMCGTVSHVRSILRNFEQRHKLSLVATLGTAFSPVTPVEELYPHMVRRYGMSSAKATFDSGTRAKLKWLDGNISATQDPPIEEQLKMKRLCIVAGTVFWARYADLRPKVMAKVAEAWLLAEMRADAQYKVNHKIEHIVERYIGSIIRSNGGQIAEIAPAVRPVPIVFPQFHATPENDEFWGKGYTEWSLLNLSKLPDLQRPIASKDGGLGYYNLTDLKTRKEWSHLARDAGVHGFMFYHYWFNGPKVPRNHMTLYRIQEIMAFGDGEPNLPFFFSWANEPWSRQWDGGDESLLLSQEYGDENDWTEHFKYLQRFFEHPRYQRIDGRPVFVIYRAGHLGNKFLAMMEHFQKLARQRMGVPGLHIVLTMGNFWIMDSATEEFSNSVDVQARFHFWPQLCTIPVMGERGNCMSEIVSPKTEKKEYHFEQPASTLLHQQLFDGDKLNYWGAATGFDARVRRPDDPKGLYLQISPDGWRKALERSFTSMNSHRTWEISQNLYFVTAWNEWNEQAVMEPSDVYEDGYLRALSRALMTVPVKTVLGGPKINRGL